MTISFHLSCPDFYVLTTRFFLFFLLFETLNPSFLGNRQNIFLIWYERRKTKDCVLTLEKSTGGELLRLHQNNSRQRLFWGLPMDVHNSFPFVVFVFVVSPMFNSNFKFNSPTPQSEWVFNHHKWLIFLLVRFWIRYLVVVCCFVRSFVSFCSPLPSLSAYLKNLTFVLQWLYLVMIITSPSTFEILLFLSTDETLWKDGGDERWWWRKKKKCVWRLTKYTKMGMINNDVWLFFFGALHLSDDGESASNDSRVIIW